MKKILITGASGQLGSAVIETMLKTISSNEILVLTRNQEKWTDFQSHGFNAFLGSYEHVNVLENSMEDVDTVLLISSRDQGHRIQEHKNVIDAAKKKGVKRLAYTSRCLRNRTTLVNELMEEHFATEEYILQSQIPYTFFRNILYMDAIPQLIGGNAALEKGIMVPAGEGKVSFALRSEMGEAIAKVLLQEESGNKIYHFTGATAWSFYDVAEALTELTGRNIYYHPVTKEAFAEQMRKRNLPEAVIQKIVGFITDIAHHQESEVFHDLQKELQRKPAGLKEGLKKVFNL